MYSTGSRKGELIMQASTSDVATLNALTAANATRVLYYAPDQPRHEIITAYKTARRVRASSGTIATELAQREVDGYRRVLAVSPSCAQLSMKLSFLHTLPKRAARMRRILLQRPFPRHPELTCWLKAYTEVDRRRPPSKVTNELQKNRPDLYLSLSCGRRAYLGPTSLRRIPGLTKEIVRAFES